MSSWRSYCWWYFFYENLKGGIYLRYLLLRPCKPQNGESEPISDTIDHNNFYFSFWLKWFHYLAESVCCLLTEKLRPGSELPAETDALQLSKGLACKDRLVNRIDNQSGVRSTVAEPQPQFIPPLHIHSSRSLPTLTNISMFTQEYNMLQWYWYCVYGTRPAAPISDHASKV